MIMSVVALVELKPVDVKSYELENGLKVFVIEDHSAPVVTVQVWYKVGSKHEPLGMTGSAHLLEHMMFRGSKHVEGDYSRIIDELGGMDNAFTSFDETAYFAEVPKSALEKVIMMEADRMRHLTFEGFEEERNVVIEERRWRTENDPEGALWEALFATSFWVHPYHHPVIGWRSDLENVSLKQIKDFYNTYYAPNNAYLIVVGDVEAEEVFKLARKYFGKYEPADIPPFYTMEPEQNGIRRTEIRKEGFATYLAMTFLLPHAKHEDVPALDILSEIVGGGKSSILYRKILDEKQLASHISAFTYQLRDHGLFVVYAVLQQGRDVKELEHEILNVLDSLENYIDAQSIERAKNKLLADFVYNRETALRQAFLLGSYLINTDDPDYINKYPKLLQKVSLEDVKRVASKYIDTKRMNVIIVHPIEPSDIQAYYEGLKKKMEIKR